MAVAETGQGALGAQGALTACLVSGWSLQGWGVGGSKERQRGARGAGAWSGALWGTRTHSKSWAPTGGGHDLGAAACSRKAPGGPDPED